MRLTASVSPAAARTPVSRSFRWKDWSQRPGEENKVEAITARAMGYFSQIKDAMVFAFNLPAIVELGTATGFDFELIDQGRSGPRKTDPGA